MAVLYRDALRMPFLSDDCVFLDQVRRLSFVEWWGFREPFFGWWRPWSREFHYGALQALFGPNELVFHVANFVLIAASLLGFHALARRFTHARAAGLATAGLSAMAAWGLPALSISGVQELWMILLGLLALLAWESGRTRLATLAFAFALASKETACLLPGIFLAHDLILRQRPAAEALRRVAPSVVLLFAWAAVHPHLGGRWLWHVPLGASASSESTAPPLVLLRALGSLASLDRLPSPESGWLRVGVAAIPAALLLAAGAWLLATRTVGRKLARRSSGRRLVLFCLSWMLLGWLPLMLPSLSWHAYYALFGSLGAWVILGAWLARGPLALGVGLIAALVIPSAGRGDTRTEDWADASFQRDAGRQTNQMRRSLLARRSGFPPGSRLYFTAEPEQLAFLTEVLQKSGASLRVWYRDSALSAAFVMDYAPRDTSTSQPAEFFFRLDPQANCEELPTADRDSLPDPERPGWRSGHEALGAAFAQAGDWSRAHAEYDLLARMLPRDQGLAFGACLTALNAGDTAAASRWLEDARRRPGDDEKLRLGLEQLRRQLLERETRAR